MSAHRRRPSPRPADRPTRRWTASAGEGCSTAPTSPPTRRGRDRPVRAARLPRRGRTSVIPRYSLPEMAALFTDEARLEMWLEVELLAVEAWAEVGDDPRARPPRRCGPGPPR